MKKSILILFLVMPLITFGQRFYGGVMAGLTASQVDGDTYSGYNKPGITAGAFVGMNINTNLGLNMELGYNAKGARETGTVENPVHYKLALHYISLPLFLTYTLNKKFAVEGGLSTSYLMAYHAEGMDGTGNISEILDAVPIKKIDISYLVGFGYHITDHFYLNFRFSYSIFAIRKYENADFNYGPIAKLFGVNNGDYNNTISFSGYYKF